MSKINYGKAEIIKELETGIRLIKYNGRYYTAYGRLFAVKGNQIETDYNTVCGMEHYSFADWNTLSDMYLDR